MNAAKFIGAAGPNNLKGALEAIKLVQSGKKGENGFKYHIPDDYEENFEKARLTFQYQRVFDP